MTGHGPEVSIQPEVRWPRQVVAGGSYLITVDLRLTDPAAPWPYEQEEFAVGCMLDGRPVCTVRALGDPGVVLHRFGGTYGPARFVAEIPADRTDLTDAALWLTLTTGGGVPFYISKLPLDGSPAASGGDVADVAWIAETGDAETDAPVPVHAPEPRQVVAAIDFGTYGTGFAWTTVSPDNSEMSSRRISFFEDWEDQKVSYPKNRSAVLLDSAGQLLAWGYQAMARMEAMPRGAGWRLQTGFKMSLQGGTGPAAVAAVGSEEGVVLADRAADAYRLTVLYLRQVVAAARDHITRGIYQDSDIQWCVTVPAIWTAYTRDLMFRAAVEAGLPDDPEHLLLAQEPAAAALYCAAKGETLLRTPGTRFLVVDAGGGTVDVTSYQVTEDGRLSELAPASGAKTGSDYLNAAFMNDVLVKQFGLATITRIVVDQLVAVTGTMDAWERAKRAFPPDSSADLMIPLSASFYAALLQEQAAGRWDGSGAPATEVVISRDQMASLFDRRIDEIIGCVEQQLREIRSVTGIAGDELALLVGGFADSSYLRARLGEQLAQRGVRIVVPEQPSVAVLAGAVHFAYDPAVFMTWRAPFTVGLMAVLPFRPGHDPEDKRIIGSGNRAYCRDRFAVLVANRQAVPTHKPVTRTLRPIHESQTEVTFQLFRAAGTDAEYITDPGVELLASLRIDLSDLLHLPVEQRTAEVGISFGQTHIRVEARKAGRKQPQPVDIQWRPDLTGAAWPDDE